MDIKFIDFLLCLSTIILLLNEKYFKLPKIVSLYIGSIAASIILLILDNLNIIQAKHVISYLTSIDFKVLIMDFILALLLFAGSIQLRIPCLRKEKDPILLLSTLGVVISAFLFGSIFYVLAQLIGLQLPFLLAILVGIIVSPTDPIIILNLLLKSKTPKPLKMILIGESLFNDGIAIVLFVVVSRLINMEYLSISLTENIHWWGIISLLISEIGGAVISGIILGYLLSFVIKQTQDHFIHIISSLSFVLTTYRLDDTLNISGPIAVIIGGLTFAYLLEKKDPAAHKSYNRLFYFWEIIDEILNACLFFLVGFQVLSMLREVNFYLLGLLSFVILLGVRWISVYIPLKILSFKKQFSPETQSVLTWGGLRGGLCLALALSIHEGIPYKEAIIVTVFIVATCSILVQGHIISRKFSEQS